MSRLLINAGLSDEKPPRQCLIGGRAFYFVLSFPLPHHARESVERRKSLSIIGGGADGLTREAEEDWAR